MFYNWYDQLAENHYSRLTKVTFGKYFPSVLFIAVWYPPGNKITKRNFIVVKYIQISAIRHQYYTYHVPKYRSHEHENPSITVYQIAANHTYSDKYLKYEWHICNVYNLSIAYMYYIHWMLPYTVTNQITRLTLILYTTWFLRKPHSLRLFIKI